MKAHVILGGEGKEDPAVSTGKGALNDQSREVTVEQKTRLPLTRHNGEKRRTFPSPHLGGKKQKREGSLLSNGKGEKGLVAPAWEKGRNGMLTLEAEPQPLPAGERRRTVRRNCLKKSR